MKIQTAIIAFLILTPTANALVLNVPNSLNTDGSVFTQTFDKQNGIDFSFNFNPAIYNTTGLNNSSIREGTITIDYFVDEVTATGFTNFFGKLLGTITQSREYDTSIAISGTDYYNVTTLFQREQGFLQGFTFKICSGVSYFHNGTTTGGGVNCQTNTIGGSPNHMTHVLKYGYVFDNGTTRGFLTRIFTDETRQGGDLVTSTNLPGNAQIDANFTQFTTSVTGSLRNLAQDASTTKITYLFTTFANHDTITQQTQNADDNCKAQRGFISAVGQTLLHWATLGHSPECFTSEDAINAAFGLVNFGLIKVFGFFPGGDKAAAFLTTLLAIVVGIPIYATTLFLSDPPRTFVFITWYLTILGLMRYGLGNYEGPNVIWDTPVNFWKLIFTTLIKFAKWLYTMVVAVVQAIASAL